MSQQIVRQLSVLKRESGKHLHTSFIHGFSTASGGTLQLIRKELPIPNTKLGGPWDGEDSPTRRLE